MKHSDQGELFATAELPHGTRHSEMLERAILHAHRDGLISDLDEAALSLARANAMALDQAEADRKYYAIAQLSGPYLEILTALKLHPSAREEDATDAITEALAALSTPEIRNT